MPLPLQAHEGSQQQCQTHPHSEGKQVHVAILEENAMRKITSRLYGRWIQSWEERLCYRATNRVVRRFEWGLDWAGDWPCAVRYPKNGDAIEDYVSQLNQIAGWDRDAFFGYEG